MTFKEWLISEAGGPDGGSNFFYGLQLYPSDAFDYVYSTNNPPEHYFLQKRWELEREEGRKFHNINEPEFQKIGYVSVKSNMPDADGGFWQHQADQAGGSTKPVYHRHLENLAFGKNSKDIKKLNHVNPPLKLDLDGLFGDRGTNSVPTLSKDFDQPWRKVYENLFGYDIVGNSTAGIRNDGLGVRSKYVGPDDTGEKDVQRTKIADFGMDRKRKSKKYLRKHK